MTAFDPNQHRMIPAQRWFEDFVLNQRKELVLEATQKFLIRRRPA